jgi:5-formyltetrahydrofolate cyclo-ligase
MMYNSRNLQSGKSYSKEEIRLQIGKEKKQLSTEYLVNASLQICNKIETINQFINSTIIVSYWPLAKEVDLRWLNDKYFNQKITLLPTIEKNEIVLKQYTGQQNLINGTLNIKEPVGEVFNNFNKIDLILVPGIAFDKNNNRLGRGKGYYDRFLKKTSAFKVGVCFKFQYLHYIPVNEYDMKVNDVVID